MIIKKEEIELLPSSQLDEVGTIFKHNGRIFRTINKEYVSFYENLFTGSLSEKLVAHGVVETKIAAEKFEDSGLLLEHKVIPVINYAYEWSLEMYWEAARMVCDLEAFLLENGMTLKDGHAWNVCFDERKPAFVDVGSIVPFAPQPFANFVREFRYAFIIPILYHLAGLQVLNRAMLRTNRVFQSVPVYRNLFGHMSLVKVWQHYLHERLIRRQIKRDSGKTFKLLNKEMDLVSKQIQTKLSRNFGTNAIRWQQWSSVERQVLSLSKKQKIRSVLFLLNKSKINPERINKTIERVSIVELCADDSIGHSDGSPQYSGEGNFSIFDPRVSMIRDNVDVISLPYEKRMKAEIVVGIDVMERFIREHKWSLSHVSTLLSRLCEHVCVLCCRAGEFPDKNISPEQYLQDLRTQLETHFLSVDLQSYPDDHYVFTCYKTGAR